MQTQMTPGRRHPLATALLCALLLPGIPGIEMAAEQVALTKRKAHIRADEVVKLYRFEAEVLK